MSKQQCRISKKRSNFSIISNTVAQALNYDLSALGLYVYLFSLPHDWVFYKSHLRAVCNIGEKKLNNLLKILSDHNLITIAQIRKDNGQFSHFDIDINDGSAFIHRVQPDGNFCRTVENGGAVKQSYKEDIKAFNKDDKKQREPERKKRVPLSDSFSFNAENQKLCQERNIDTKSCEEKFKAYALAKKIKSVDWQAEAKLWIFREKISINDPLIKKIPTELKQTVKFWEPGNPDYDRVNGSRH